MSKLKTYDLEDDGKSFYSQNVMVEQPDYVPGDWYSKEEVDALLRRIDSMSTDAHPYSAPHILKKVSLDAKEALGDE